VTAIYGVIKLHCEALGTWFVCVRVCAAPACGWRC
jgi:hypothetical protein